MGSRLSRDCLHDCLVSVHYIIAIGSSVQELFLNNYKSCNYCDYLFEFLSNEML